MTLPRSTKIQRTPRREFVTPLPLPSSDAALRASLGDKAWRLSEAMRLGLPTPGGWVLGDDALQLFLDAHRLREPIAAALSGVDVARPESFADVSREITQHVVQSALPAEILSALERVLAEHAAADLLVVRSSAVGEDSHDAAFAGQLDSILHVAPTLESLANAVRSCWASYWSGRVLFYQQTRGVALQGMGVLIQRQIDAAWSGVLFTRSPEDSAAKGEMLVEYCQGLGDDLASGRITPRRARLMHAGGAVRVASGNDSRDGRLDVDPAALIRLGQAALRLEQHFHAPQDVEWSLDRSGAPIILQSRPITTLREKEEPVIWSNVNVNENYPDPVCPLLFSVAQQAYYHYFRNLGEALGIARWRIALMETPLRHIVGAQGGRLYYNLSNIHDVLRMAPFGEHLVEWFNQFVGASRAAPTLDRDRSWRGVRRSSIGQALEASWCVLSTTRRLLGLSRGVRRFEHRVDRFAAECEEVLSQPTDSPTSMRTRQLMRQFQRFLEIRRHGWLEASLADAAAMMAYGVWGRFVKAEFPHDQASALQNTLLKGLRDVVSGEPALQLWDLSRSIQADETLRSLFDNPDDPAVLQAIRRAVGGEDFRRGFDKYLAEWGFRCSGELTLTTPSFQERPGAVIAMLRYYSRLQGPSPRDALQQQQEQRLSETKRVMREFRRRPVWRWLPWPRKSLMARRLLRWTQQAVMCRERARLKQALLYSLLRRICLALGRIAVSAGKLEQPDDLLYLSTEEMEQFHAGGALFPDFADLIRRRREVVRAREKQKPPDTLVLPRGECWRGDADERREATSATRESAASGEEASWRGQGVCGGRVVGPACVLNDVTETQHLRQDGVLVARQTDPGWGPVFLLIRGLVMERGGMLSHGAILAREYGLPTVVGVADATSRIEQGRMILVDGDRGIVQLHRA